MLVDYSKTKPKENERTFDFFVRRDPRLNHYSFGIWYFDGKSSGSGGGDTMYPEVLLIDELTNLEASRDEALPNNKPIKVRFHGKTFSKHSSSLESLLKIYARSEGVPVEFEYLPSIRRK